MKIAIVYFNSVLSDDRKHHTVYDWMLKGWMYFYQKSYTTLQPCLLTDELTKIPSFWPYEVCVLKDSVPPTSRDILNKVGWMKAQAFNLVQDCLVMDMDALILKDITEIQDIKCDIAMAKDFDSHLGWEFSNRVPELPFKYNAGVMLLRSSKIFSRFKELWLEKEKISDITYYDEILFNLILNEMNGIVLEHNYNGDWNLDNTLGYKDICKDVKILHFRGYRKLEMKNFLKENMVF